MWDNLADGWLIQVGDEGDRNRIQNSDPVLWQFAGSVRGSRVMDAGCGTGYLSNKLYQQGANVIGVDFAPRMLEIARTRYPDIDFRLDDCSQLETVDDDYFDLLISNYMLMDTPDLDGTVNAFHRVLKLKGTATLIFSHPCFVFDTSESSADGQHHHFHWDFPYLEARKCIDQPWAHFTSKFIWFHRPLSDYFKAFKTEGFVVVDFEEPRIQADKYHLVTDPS